MTTYVIEFDLTNHCIAAVPDATSAEHAVQMLRADLAGYLSAPEDFDATLGDVTIKEITEDDDDDPWGEEQPIIDRMEQYGDDDGDPTRYDEDDPMYRGGPNEDMSWLDEPED